MMAMMNRLWLTVTLDNFGFEEADGQVYPVGKLVHQTAIFRYGRELFDPDAGGASSHTKAKSKRGVTALT